MIEQEYTFSLWHSDKDYEYARCSICRRSFQIEKGVEETLCPNPNCKNTLRREK